MKTITSLKKEDIKRDVEKMIEKNTKINSDKSNSYNDLDIDYNLNSQVIKKHDINKMMPWVHTAISNAKRLLLDVHHRIDDDFLQNYLNEFCYKFNRRYFNNLFDRLMVAAISYRWDYLGETKG